ncbi:MAG: glycosyltransferase [Flavobacteriales bacterium]|nr:MAG: glycosyltransferase [Flavobacteriales bacterium]
MQKILFIGLTFPESASTAAGIRMLQLIGFFKEQNCQITFASVAQETEFTDVLSAMNVKKLSIRLNHPSFDEFVKKLQPEIVLFDRFITEEQFGWRVAEHCPNAVRILDTEDLHCLRFARQESFRSKTKFELGQLNKLDIAKREIASIYRCDISLIISPFEYRLLINHFSISSEILLELPFMFNRISKKEIEQNPSFEERKDFISIGNFKHEPNWQSVLYLKKSIWPLIKKQIPRAKLLVYGAYPTQKVFDLYNGSGGFIVKGRAEDAHKVISESKILLAPLQFGAGLKGKLIDAMLTGTPSVTTSIGAEGMHGNLEWNGYIADKPDNFAKKAVELYQNKNLWQQAQQNGIIIINRMYSKKQWSEKLRKKINVIQQNLEMHRTHNFMGSVLQHHTLQSTKYMSKWIEEKGKK